MPNDHDGDHKTGHGDCGHAHHDHSHDHSGHSHSTKSNNHGLLKWAFSKVNGSTGDWLNRNRRKIVLGAGAACAAAEYMMTNNTALSSLIMLFSAAAVTHDASEDIMESTRKLEKSQNLPSEAVGIAVGVGHTLSEGAFSLFSTIQGNSDVAVASVMGSNASHILLMAGGAVVIGKVGAGQSTAWKLHAAGIAGTSGVFGYQVMQGEFVPALGVALAAGGGHYIYKRFFADEGCAIHGSGCSGHHGKTHSDEVSEPQKLTFKQRITDPELLNLGGSVVALSAAGHVLGHQIITQSQILGMSETSAGASIAALSLAAPEIILTWKAAHKGDSKMAFGAITGCTVATVALVGGALAAAGVDVPQNLNIATTEGQWHMATFLGSAAAMVGVTHREVIKRISRDGQTIPKAVGVAFLSAAALYYANVTQPNCHWEWNLEKGEIVPHCVGGMNTETESIPAAPFVFE